SDTFVGPPVIPNIGNVNLLHGGGGFGGGQVGCNVLDGAVVLGLEAEAWSGLTNRNFFNIGNFADSVTRNRWSAGVALRAGVALDRALLYGKTGVAAGRFDFSSADSVCDSAAGHSTLSGLLLGVGVEYAFAPNWSAKLEYDHVEYFGKTVRV